MSPIAPTALALSFLLLLTSAAGAQVIDSVSPAEGPHGTIIIVTGTDFGSGKPKVTFTSTITNKKVPLKVLGFSPTAITVLVKKAKVGPYGIQVQPKGGSPVETLDAFTVRAPEITAINGESEPLHAEIDPFDVVTVQGESLGGKKGTVTVGGKKAKVLLWADAPAAPELGEPALGMIQFRMKKALPNSTYDVEVKTSAGSTVLHQAITVVNSTEPKLGSGADTIVTGKDVTLVFSCPDGLTGEVDITVNDVYVWNYQHIGSAEDDVSLPLTLESGKNSIVIEFVHADGAYQEVQVDISKVVNGYKEAWYFSGLVKPKLKKTLTIKAP